MTRRRTWRRRQCDTSSQGGERPAALYWEKKPSITPGMLLGVMYEYTYVPVGSEVCLWLAVTGPRQGRKGGGGC
jgi:hypothetical protein